MRNIVNPTPYINSRDGTGVHSHVTAEDTRCCPPGRRTETPYAIAIDIPVAIHVVLR